MASTPGMIDGYGNGGGFEFSIVSNQGADIRDLFAVSEGFIGKLQAGLEIQEAYSGYDINDPQYAMDVDASRCKKWGISPATVVQELSAYLGSAYVSNLNLYNQVYQVTMQLRPMYRERIAQLDQIFVRSEQGAMLPVSQFVRLRKEYRPQVVNAINMMSCIGVTGMLAEGTSSGTAIRLLEEMAESQLPAGYDICLTGSTREENEANRHVPLIFVLSLFFIYCVMVGLYESLLIPLAVLFSVPFGLAGSFLFAWLFGIENNLYLQIGLIMLIGLLCKTAVLLTEHASQCRASGMTLAQSALASAKMRLRPILMTSLTMVCGMLPLAFATGVGANGSRTIGIGTVGGMVCGTVGLLLITPTLFIVFKRWEENQVGK